MGTIDPFLAAAIGASGAIAAQAVAARATARRDLWRAEIEDKRRTADREAERAARFADVRRETYSRFAELTYEAIEACRRVEGPESTGIKTPRLVGSIDSMDPLRWQVRLIGSRTVVGRSELCYTLTVLSLLQVGVLEEFQLERRTKTTEHGLRAWEAMVEAMRADLRGDAPALEAMMRADRTKSEVAPEIDRAAIDARLDELLSRHQRHADRAQ